MEKFFKNAWQETEEQKKFFQNNEAEANMTFGDILGTVSICCILFWFLCLIHVYDVNMVLANTVVFGGGILTAAVVGLCHELKGKRRDLKYLMITDAILLIFGLNFVTGFKIYLLFALPILLATRYFNQMFLIVTDIISCVMIILSAFLNVYVAPTFGLIDLNMVSYQEPTDLHVVSFLYQPVTSYGLDQLLVLKNTLLLSALPNILVLCIITAAALVLLHWAQETMTRFARVAEQNADLQIEMSKNREQMLLSQLKPHFLYNALSAIMAIDGNPEETVDALGNFG